MTLFAPSTFIFIHSLAVTAKNFHQKTVSTMQLDTEQVKSQTPSPSRQRSRKKKGRKKENDRKRLDDVKLINFHEHPPKHSFLRELALQLDRMENGVKSAIVYSYATSLPNKFDPRHAPEDLQGNETLKQRLSTFYNLRTVRKCPVNYKDEASGQKKRCPRLSRGVADIIHHQTVDHGRPCYYLCLKPDCLAAFSKICNAKRHVEKIHPEHCYERATADEDKKCKKKTRESPDSDDNPVSEEHQRRELRRVREGQVPKRSIRRKIGKERGHERRNHDEVTLTPEMAEHVTRGSRLPRGLKLKAHSEISITSKGDVLLTVTPAEGTSVDIESLQSNLRNAGFEDVSPKNEEMKEWVAATALLKIAYHPKKVFYKFKPGVKRA